MQITDRTRKILSDEKGEIKDHYVNLEENETTDPNYNIATGIRWLFRKKEILDKRRRKNKPTWIDAVAAYKAFSRNHPKMKKFENLYDRAKKGKK